MPTNKVMVFAGIATLFQAVGQMIYSALAIAQYFCVVDFLRGLPLLLYVRILYFHNPDSCGIRINIGQSIDGIADQAFVLLTRESLPAFRTFIINSTGLGLSVLWILTSSILITGGAKEKQSKHIRWPWIIITTCICVLDLVATVTYCNDTFYTRTLSDMMDFIGGVASGTAGVNLDTTWTSWLMVIIYSRFVVFFILNLVLIVLIIVDCNVIKKEPEDIDYEVEAPAVDAISTTALVPTPPAMPPATTEPDRPMEAPPDVAPVISPTTVAATTQTTIESNSDKDVEVTSLPSNRSMIRIPRPGISQSFKRMKNMLFKRSASPDVRSRSNPDSLNISSERSPQMQHVDEDKKRGVNFPETLLSLPQRLENMIAEQQRRLDKAVIDTAGRHSPPRVSQSMPQLTTSSNQPDTRGRHGTTVELQGQLPWAYIPASAHRMRDQLPPDEDLPPVPLPDYTAIQSFRKASVHRAASSLSSLTQKKDYSQSRPALTQSDVLY